MLDRRPHIGGNAYSPADPETGIEIHRYGPHFFHTSNETVWAYLHRFTEFTDFELRVWTTHRGEAFPLPINLATICQFFGRSMSPSEARALIASQAAEVLGEPANLEDKAIASIGRPLYEAFIRNYTQKQWQTDPRDLPPSIIARLPVRYTFENRYFSDRFQGLPVGGYAPVFEKMLGHPNIEVRLATDWLPRVRKTLPELEPSAARRLHRSDRRIFRLFRGSPRLADDAVRDRNHSTVLATRPGHGR